MATSGGWSIQYLTRVLVPPVPHDCEQVDQSDHGVVYGYTKMKNKPEILLRFLW